MTTIAYRDGVLAADTQATHHGGGIVSLRTIKIGARNGVLWAGCGDSSWCKKFRDWMHGGMNGNLPVPDENTAGLIFAPDGNIIVQHCGGVELRTGLPFWADGSGQDYALGAMQAGATAEEAVRAAMAWDTKTGGEIVMVRR